jgi:arsenate reductase
VLLKRMRARAPDHPYNVMFLCTGNSVRSIMGEAVLNKIGARKFHAYSAGSLPKGEVHPRTLELLKRFGYAIGDLRSTSWDEFAGAHAPALDFVFTVCDSAASEVCPVWPGQPMTAHWGVPDPAAAEGSEEEIAQAFREAYKYLHRRIELFVNLPVQSLDRMSLKKHLDDIGTTGPSS